MILEDIEYSGPVHRVQGASVIGDFCERNRGHYGMVVPTLDNRPHALVKDRPCKFVQAKTDCRSCLECPYKLCLLSEHEKYPRMRLERLANKVGMV